MDSFGKEVDDTKRKINDAGKELDNAANHIDNFGKKTISAVQRLRAIKAELNNFKGSQQQFESLTLEAAKLTDQIRKTNERISVLASSTRSIQGLASAFQGLTGLFTAFQGAQALFGKESENVNRALVKLQGSLALLQGVQAAVATITEQSAAKTVLASAAQQAYTFVVGESTGALKAFRIGLAATGIGLAVIAIAELVAHWDELKEAITGVSKEQKELNQARAEGFKSYSDEATKVGLLINRYEDANTTTKERKDILKELNDISPSYFKNLDTEKVKVNDLRDAYTRYVEALKIKGTIDILTKKLSELNIKSLEAEQNIVDAARASSDVFGNATQRVLGFFGLTTGTTAQTAKELGNTQDQMKKLTEEIENQLQLLHNVGGDPTKQAEKVAEQIFPAGTIKALQQKIDKITEKLQITDPDSTLFAQLTSQAIKLEFELENIRKKFENIIPPNIDNDVKKLKTAFDKGLKPEGKQEVPDLFEKTKDGLKQTKAEFATFAEEFEEISKQFEAQLFQSVQTAYNTIFEIATKSRQDNLTADLASLDRRKDFELSAANLTALQKIKIDENYRKQQAQIKLKAFKADQEAAIAQAVINGAVGATKTIAELGFVASLPAVLAEATAILAQVALIKTQQPPAFAEGVIDLHQPGEVKGRDSIPAILMPGESVIKTDRTQQYLPELKAIQEGRLEELIRVNYVEPSVIVKAMENDRIDSQAILDYSEKFYRQLLETKDTNTILKKIDYKLGRDNERAILLKLKRRF